jgi:RNA polymerase-associated protein CTR9
MESEGPIRIPLENGTDFVEVYPDELPLDVNDIVDVLKAEFAPLKIWRAAAVCLIL